ncbi:MAG: thymidine phosphorylase [Gemmatimonadaceae bacterium]
MLAYRLIERKRDGGRIEAAEWHTLVRAYAAGQILDYQMAAFLMAVYLRGLDSEETSSLTEAMLATGQKLDFSTLAKPRVDKHSTGGVGDKVSIVLAPLIASLGVAVPMMSGRGLAHTGGTLDKLESIPGFRTDLTLAETTAQVASLGCALVGQSLEIAPADMKMYALRDTTATVESIPLMAASIMSKKLAEGLTGLVLDVKCGRGAFVSDLDRSIELASTMIALGAAHDCPTVALITAMDRPLGRACGNALETEEAIHALHGEGPADLMEVTFALGGEMLLLAGVVTSHAEALRQMEGALTSGKAAALFARVIEAQGGNKAVVEDPSILPQAEACEIFVSTHRGFVSAVDPRAIGRGVLELGGGRTRMQDSIDPSVGFVITAKPGDWVEQGEPLATIFAQDSTGVDAGRTALTQAIQIADEAEPPLPLVSHRVSIAGTERLTDR